MQQQNENHFSVCWHNWNNLVKPVHAVKSKAGPPNGLDRLIFMVSLVLYRFLLSLPFQIRFLWEKKMNRLREGFQKKIVENSTKAGEGPVPDFPLRKKEEENKQEPA